MDRENVIEFLGQVTLLQRLPSSSIKKVAELVQLKHYSSGDYIIREGEADDGLYIIWDGQVLHNNNHMLQDFAAEVSGSVNMEESSRQEYQLKKYDYFAYDASVHQVKVIALSKLSCLSLPRASYHLLQPKSIWNADGKPTDFSLMEQILHLEPLEVDIFHGFTVPGAPSFGQIFGGQLIGQALAAVSKTVDFLKLVHSLHAFFIMTGDVNAPVLYQVYRVRDGNSFANRRVEAKQRGVVIFTLLASFQKEEAGFQHQDVMMPDVPTPETLPSMEELRAKRITDPRLPMHYRNNVARKNFLPWPIEIRYCDSSNSARQSKSRLNYWFRARGKLSDDQALHRCVLAYASDLLFACVRVDPHRRKDLKTTTLSLDHSMWFHRPIKADDWTLFAIESPIAFGGRGYVFGRMFNEKGELLVSLTLEGVTRKAKIQKPTPTPKL